MLGRANTSISARTYLNQILFSQLKIPDALWKAALIAILLVVILYIFFGTELGASIRATGNNPKMSRAQGINTKFNIVFGALAAKLVLQTS